MQDYLTLNDLDSTSDNNLESREDSEIETNVSDSSTGGEFNIDAKPEDGGSIINVEDDFDGNLANAIAAANDGDVVQLDSGTYNTAGIVVDKDITIAGQQGSVIDGGGTQSAVFEFTPDATGATIQNLEITNANNGIYGYGASNLTLQNLTVTDIGISQTTRSGENNTGIILNYADGLQLLDSNIQNIGKKGVGIGATDGATIRGLEVQNVNLAAEHSQSHDAAGVKLYNTNDVSVEDSYFSDINANNIWNDTSNNTLIAGNVIEINEDSYQEPDFDDNIAISGIYNEKSPNSVVRNNSVTSSDEFLAFNATEFTAETLVIEDNDFPTQEIGTRDYWANEEIEKLIALTEDASEANFSILSDEYYGQANIG